MILFFLFLFTLWSFFGQYRALTHGPKVVRGVYDDPNDPGAINHFQALSAALSGTVGLGNIAGVAVAADLLTHGLRRVDELTGADTREDVLDRVFERFCIGK